MKHQYVGDINDYRKYGLLRALLAAGGLRLHVVWMLTPDDGRTDGSKTRYLDDPERWAGFDPPLFSALARALSAAGRREVGLVEASDVLPRTTYQRELLEDDGDARRRYMARVARDAAGAELVFLDPDNGLEVRSVPRGRRGSSKYLYLDEVAGLWSRGHSLLIYQHYPRVQRDAFCARSAARLADRTGPPWIASFSTSHVVFLLVPRPEHASALAAAAAGVERRWHGQIAVARHPRGGRLTSV